MAGNIYNFEMEQQLFASLTAASESRARSVHFQDTPDLPKRKHMRDSQKSREHVGNPGSKKHNRYLNKMELLDKALSDSESELEIEVEFTVEFKSPFSILFQDEGVKERWEPFIEITEQEQTELLSMFYFDAALSSPKKRKETPTAPHDCFKLLSREERRLLRNQAGSHTIERIEDSIINFIVSPRTSMTTMLPPFERLLLSLTSVYYSLKANVHNTTESEKVGLTIRKPNCVQLPSVRLSEYLKTLQHSRTK